MRKHAPNVTQPLHLARVLGPLPAQVTHQIQYWISKCGRKIDGESGLWIYNSFNEWHSQFPYCSESTIRRKFKNLESLGILRSKKINAKRWNQTKWYTVDEERLAELRSKTVFCSSHPSKIAFAQNEQIDVSKMNTSYKYTKKYLYKTSSKRKEEVLEIQSTADKDTLTQQVYNFFRLSRNIFSSYLFLHIYNQI